MQADPFGDAHRTLAAFDLDHHAEPGTGSECDPHHSSKLHFGDVVWNIEFGFRHRQHLGDPDSGRCLLQRRPAAGEADHPHVRHHEIDRPRRG